MARIENKREKIKNEKPSNEKQGNEKKINVVVVEDDVQYQRLLGEMLRELGYTPYLAATGWKGLKECQRIHPSLVLTDIFMPYLDGVKFIEMIRQSEVYIPIIAITGGLSGANKQQSLQSAWLRGADATLSKPIDIDDLQEAIEKLLKTHHAARQSNEDGEFNL